VEINRNRMLSAIRAMSYLREQGPTYAHIAKIALREAIASTWLISVSFETYSGNGKCTPEYPPFNDGCKNHPCRGEA
jgi:hypothetical protein